ncbi:MAG TPA: YcnI family protein [Actinomycetota bacterium]|nr:YcnI family protein [Actinomycetota bacterium]
MRRVLAGALAGALVAVFAPAAAAHVTVQPSEAIAGSFSRFVVRVPNERPDADTTKVVVKMPPLAFVSFEPKDGWKRKTKTVTLDEPIEAFGQEITETTGRVTWSGGRIGPGEFVEFGFSAKMPDGEESLEFKAIQTYTGGEVVRWTGAADSETPAASLTTYDLGLEEGQGELAALAELRGGDAPAEGDGAAGGDDEGSNSTATILSGLALVFSLIALTLALRRGRTAATT